MKVYNMNVGEKQFFACQSNVNTNFGTGTWLKRHSSLECLTVDLDPMRPVNLGNWHVE